MKNRLSNIAFRTALLYGVFGAIWILISDIALITLVSEPSVLRDISIYKGWFFVAATAVLLYFGLLKQIHRWEREAAERKAAERELTTSNAQLINALSFAHLGHWEYDVATDLFTFNEQFYKMLHTTAEEIGGYTITGVEYARRFIHPDDIAILFTEIRKAVETPSPHLNQQFEYRNVYADGETGYIATRLFVLKDNHGKAVKLYGVNQDITEHKKNEAALNERLQLEARLSKLTAAVPGVLFTFRMKPDGSISFPYISQEIETLSGFRPEDLKEDATPAFKRAHPEDINRVNESIRESARTLSPWNQEFRAQFPQRGEVWIETHSIPEREPDGSILWYGFFHDITERKHAEEALKASEDKFFKAFWTSPDSVNINRMSDGLCIEINQGFTALTGYTPEEAVGKTSLELNIWADPKDRERLVRGLRERGGVTNMETSFRMKNGSIRTGLMSARIITVNSEVCILSITRDITERRQVEEALRENEYLLRTSQEVAGIASYSFNVQTGIWLLSKNYDEIFGTDGTFTPAGIDGWIGLVHPDQRKEMHDYLIIHVIKEHNNFNREYKIIRPCDGEERWIHQLGEIEFDEHGNTKVITGIIQDITERRQVENSLRMVITGARCLLWRAQVIRHGTEYHWNLRISNEDAAMEFLPVFIEPGQSYSDAWQKSKFEEERLHLDRNYHDALEHQRPGYHQEFGCRLKDGSVKWLYEDVRITPTMPGQWELVGVCTDITEQKRMREALQESNRKLSTTVNNLQGLVYRCANDPNWTMEYISEGIVELAGYLANEFIMNRTRTYNSIIEPEDRVRVWEEIQKAIALREAFTIEYRIRTASGEQKWVWERGRGIFENDRLLALEGFITDITEQKRAETALRESEYLLRKSQEVGGLGSYYLDVRTGKWTSSKKLDDIFGIDDTYPKNVEGWRRLIHPEQRDEIVNYLTNHVILGRNLFEKEYRIIRQSDKKERWLHGSGELEFYDNGDVKAMIGTIRDITEHKQEEEARMNLETQLRQSQKLESLGTLAAGIAHDFNNILGILLGYTSVLPKQHEQPEKFEHSVATMTAAVKRGASMVRQLLTFARKTDVEIISVNINEMIIELSKLLNETLPKTISIELMLRNDLPTINADASQIHQVLLNLCVNARDAMPKGGSLSLSTSVVENQQISGYFPNASCKRYVQIGVSDTGTGMDKETRERIFEPFFTTKEKGKGTGLGLSVVFGVVKSHRGFINVESEVGSGTTFIIYLPIPEDEIVIIEESYLSDLNIPGGTETILVIEDERMLRDLVESTLTSKGYTVLIAENGIEGFELFQRHSNTIAAVFTDIGLPGMSGIDLAAKILQFHPKVKIILASGFLDPGIKSDMDNFGLKYFIQKPYMPDNVLQIVRSAIDEVA